MWRTTSPRPDGDVHYARDAFEGLRLMDDIMAVKRGEGPDPDSEGQGRRSEAAERKGASRAVQGDRGQAQGCQVPVEVPARSDVAADNGSRCRRSGAVALCAASPSPTT